MTWNGVDDSRVAGYKVYWGTSSGNYNSSHDVEDNLSYTITGLSDTQRYYFAVKSYSSNSESNFSQELVSYPIKVVPPTNGQISPSTCLLLALGSSHTYTISPNSGYCVSCVTVDGVEKGAINQYTFDNLSTSHTIGASFSILTYNVSSNISNGGLVLLNGTSYVQYGGNLSFKIVPNEGYHITDVYINGASIGAVCDYTMYNVTSNVCITADFSANCFDPTMIYRLLLDGCKAQ